MLPIKISKSFMKQFRHTFDLFVVSETPLNPIFGLVSPERLSDY